VEAFKVTNSAACTLCLNAARDDPVWGAAYFEELLKNPNVHNMLGAPS
jgi:hypothetical protein